MMDLDREETKDYRSCQPNTAAKETGEQPRKGEEASDGKGETASSAIDLRWVDPATLKVEPAFQRLIPLQSRGELLALDESIKVEGCLDPLLIWKGRNIVLDGHTRLGLCIKYKKLVPVREIDLPDEKAATEYILDIQRQRRNLTREALSYFRGAEYNATKQQRGGDRSSQKAKGQSDPLPNTAKRLADSYGVSEKTIKRDGRFAEAVDRIVAEYGDPDIRRNLLGGDVKLTHGTANVLLKKSTAELKAAVDQLIEQGGLPRARKAGAAGRRPKKMAETLISRLQAKGDKYARSVLQHMASLLGMVVGENSSR